MRKRSINIKLRISKLLKDYNMDYDLISKMGLEELKNYLRIRGLKINERKSQLVVRVFEKKRALIIDNINRTIM